LYDILKRGEEVMDQLKPCDLPFQSILTRESRFKNSKGGGMRDARKKK
jgi:hypothetical protein